MLPTHGGQKPALKGFGNASTLLSPSSPSSSSWSSCCMRWFLRLLAVAAAVIAVIVIYNTYFEDPIKYRRRKYLVVLGGGVTPTGGIPHWVKQRACRAEKLFIKSNKMNTVVTLSRGTPHKPNPLNSDGFPVYESTATALHMLEVGVPPQQVLEESYSLDTVGNAYFLRTMHVDPSNVKKLVIITNKWHMPRTKAIFQKVFSLPSRAWTPYSFALSALRVFLGPTWPYVITYDVAPDGLEGDTLLARVEREEKSLAAFHAKTQHEFYDMVSLHRWIFHSHAAYAATRHLQAPKAAIDPETLKTY